MKLFETSKFKHQRKKINETEEKEALRMAISEVLENSEKGEELKGEFKEFRSIKYSVKGQSRRLVYKAVNDTVILLSFGPRGNVYK